MRVVTNNSSANKRFLIAPIPLEREETPPLSKSDYLTLKLRSDPAAVDSTTYDLTIPFFSSGSCEQILDFVRDVKRAIRGQNITTGPGCYALMRRLIRGEALAAFNQAATDAGNETVANFDTAVEGLIRNVFPQRALITQKRIMRRFFRKPSTMTMRQFMARVLEINGKLADFPPFQANQTIPLDEILDLGEFATPARWQREMTVQNFDPIATGTVQGLVQFCERMERTEEPVTTTTKKSSTGRIPKKNKAETKGMWCPICQMNNHNLEDCRTLKRLRKERNEAKSDQPPSKRYKSNSWKRSNEGNDYKNRFKPTEEQIKMMVDKALARRNHPSLTGGIRKERPQCHNLEEKTQSDISEQFETLSVSTGSDSSESNETSSDEE